MTAKTREKCNHFAGFATCEDKTIIPIFYDTKDVTSNSPIVMKIAFNFCTWCGEELQLEPIVVTVH